MLKLLSILVQSIHLIYICLSNYCLDIDHATWFQVIEYPRHPSAASSTLVELTSRLDFFKERRSQLMEQLHNLDLNYGTTSSQDFVYRPSSPPWN